MIYYSLGFFSAFQKRVLGLLVDIKSHVARVGKSYEPAESDFFLEELDSVDKLQELENSLDDDQKRKQMVTAFFT